MAGLEEQAELTNDSDATQDHQEPRRGAHADLQQASAALDAAYDRIRQVRQSLLELSASLPLHATQASHFSYDGANALDPGHRALLLSETNEEDHQPLEGQTLSRVALPYSSSVLPLPVSRTGNQVVSTSSANRNRPRLPTSFPAATDLPYTPRAQPFSIPLDITDRLAQFSRQYELLQRTTLQPPTSRDPTQGQRSSTGAGEANILGGVDVSLQLPSPANPGETLSTFGQISGYPDEGGGVFVARPTPERLAIPFIPSEQQQANHPPEMPPFLPVPRANEYPYRSRDAPPQPTRGSSHIPPGSQIHPSRSPRDPPALPASTRQPDPDHHRQLLRLLNPGLPASASQSQESSLENGLDSLANIVFEPDFGVWYRPPSPSHADFDELVRVSRRVSGALSPTEARQMGRGLHPVPLDPDGDEIPDEEEGMRRIQLELRSRDPTYSRRHSMNMRAAYGRSRGSRLDVSYHDRLNRLTGSSSMEGVTPFYVDPLPMPLSSMMPSEESAGRSQYADIVVPKDACLAGR